MMLFPDNSLSGAEILVVDDDPVSLRLVSAILMKAGASVMTADGGAEALQIIQKHAPPILVTDISMPGIDGLTLVRNARSIDSEIRAIATSAYTEPEYLIDAIRLGFTDYVVKPVRAEQLVWAVRRCHETISALRRARMEEKRFRDVVDFLSEPLMLIDAEFRVILSNRAMSNHFDIRRGEFCYGVMGNDGPCPDCPVLRSRASGLPESSCRLLPTLRGGRAFDVTVSPLVGVDGAPGGTVILLRDVTERRAFETLISHIARGVSAEIGEAFFSSLTSFILSATGMDMAMVAELDGGSLVTHAVCGRSGAISNTSFSLDGTPCAEAISRGAMILDGTLPELFPDCRPFDLEMKSYGGVRLCDGAGTPIGVLCTFAAGKIADGRLLSDILTIFGARASAELERIRQERVIASLALHDPLTGLANRRLMEERLELLCADSERRHLSFAVVMIDLDDFKEINDRFGHAAGDELLVNVADRLRSVFRRAGDTVCRYGGDEFCVIVHDVESGDTLAELLDDLRSRLRDIPSPVPLSVSIGAVISGAGKVLPASVIDRADRAMYRSKHGGKGRVTFCGSPA